MNGSILSVSTSLHTKHLCPIGGCYGAARRGALPTYISVFRGLQTHFRRHGIELDWVLYADYDALVKAFVTREIDLAWNGPLAYVKIKRRLNDPCQVVAMRDVDVNFTTHLITHPTSGITTVEHLKGERVALGSRGSMQAWVLATYFFLQQLGLDPGRDFAACTFFEERQSSARSDERDVIERVCRGEYDAGAVSQRTLDGGTRGRGSLQTVSGFSGPVLGPQSLLLHRPTATWIGVSTADYPGLCHHRRAGPCRQSSARW